MGFRNAFQVFVQRCTGVPVTTHHNPGQLLQVREVLKGIAIY